jgi:hypothetical protein
VEQVGRAGGQRALGDLDDDVEVLAGPVPLLGQVLGARHGQRVGLDVDEQGPRAREPGRGGPAQRGGAARPVEVAQAPARPGGAEELVGPGDGGALGPAGERLVRDDLARLEVDDRLEHRDRAVPGEQRAERLGARGLLGGVGDRDRRDRLDDRPGARVLVEVHPAAPSLGPVHRDVRVLEQGVPVVRVAPEERHPDRAAHRHERAGRDRDRPRPAPRARARPRRAPGRRRGPPRGRP